MDEGLKKPRLGNLPLEALLWTETQRKVFDRRIDAMLVDFPVESLVVVLRDGERINWGKPLMPLVVGATYVGDEPPVPVKKKRRRRQTPPGYVPGTLVKIVVPWLDLAVSAPGETLRIRLDDLSGAPENVTLRRFLSSISATCCNRYGKGLLATNILLDTTLKEEVAVVTYHGPRIPEPKHTVMDDMPKPEPSNVKWHGVDSTPVDPPATLLNPYALANQSAGPPAWEPVGMSEVNKERAKQWTQEQAVKEKEHDAEQRRLYERRVYEQQAREKGVAQQNAPQEQKAYVDRIRQEEQDRMDRAARRDDPRRGNALPWKD